MCDRKPLNRINGEFMLLLQLTAIAFLVFSAAFMFGPQLVVYGPRAAMEMARQTEARFIGGFLTTAGVLAVAAPFIGQSLISGGNAMTLVVVDIFSMQFSLT